MELCLNVLFEKPEIIDLAAQIKQTLLSVEKLRSLSVKVDELLDDDVEEFEL